VAPRSSTTTAQTRAPRGQAETTDGLVESVRALTRASILLSAVCEETGLTLRQYRILLKLIDRPLRANALARSIGVTRGTLSTALTGLEKRGLLQRSPAEDDGRGVTVTITDAGQSAISASETRLVRLLVDLSATSGLGPLRQLLTDLEEPIDREATRLKERILRGAADKAQE